MPVFYFDIDRRQHFSTPPHTRMRHRLRGPRESHKINLEIDQLTFSVYKLDAIQKAFRDRLRERVDTVLGGGPIDVNDENDDPIDLLGLNDLLVQLQNLRKRVRALERGQ